MKIDLSYNFNLSSFICTLIYHNYVCIQIHRSFLFMIYSILEELGTGEFGVVTHGKWTSSSDQQIEVAIKTLNTDVSDKDRLRFLQEAAIMCQFDHQNVIKLHGVVTEGPIMIVLEYMSRGDLQNLLIKLRCVIVMHIRTELAIVYVTIFCCSLCVVNFGISCSL